MRRRGRQLKLSFCTGRASACGVTADAPTLVHDVRATLGEGPVWVPTEEALYWLDIKGLKIFRDVRGELTTWPTPFRVGSIAPCADGGFIAGCENGFAFIDLNAGRFDVLVDPEPERTDNRFNDGKVDRAGRFWAGTMDDTERASVGALYRLGVGGAPTRQDDGYRVTNGPAFNHGGDRMYHTDSALRTIYAFDLDVEGTPSNKRPFAQFTGADGYPDGMTVDAEDCLWVAFWDGWCVRRLAPSGETLATYPMPVERPTSVAFAGSDLDRLYVTSARVGLNAEALARQPHAGGLFVMTPGVRGVAERPYRGSLHG